jgi:hypothetical protein
MEYTKFTYVDADAVRARAFGGNIQGDVYGNLIMTPQTVALTADTTVAGKNLITLSSVTATKILTVNLPNGALFVVANGDSTNAATIKCSATDTGATLAKSTTGIYYNADGVAKLIK